MIRLYDFWESGNAYKVRLLLHQLEQPFERVHLEILKRETRTAEYKALTPVCRVPMVEWPDGRRLTESNAILFHLAEETEYLPADSWGRAKVLQWQNFEQYNHEPNIAVVRFWHFAGLVEENEAALPDKMSRGYLALDVMEEHLNGREFMVGDSYSVADISLYAYTHVASEGGFDMDHYPHISRWLDRVAAQPRHLAITDEIGQLTEWP